MSGHEQQQQQQQHQQQQQQHLQLQQEQLLAEAQLNNSNMTSRKKRRGLIEKRRRDKINNSLCELRKLVPAAFEKQGSAKLEKAEILQMTVDYLRLLHARGLADTLTSNMMPSSFALNPVQQQPSERAPISGSQQQLCGSPPRLSHQSNQSASLMDSQFSSATDNSSAPGSQSDQLKFESQANNNLGQSSTGDNNNSSNGGSSNSSQQLVTSLQGQTFTQLGRQVPMSELMNSTSPSMSSVHGQSESSPNSLSHNQAAVMVTSAGHHPHHFYNQHHQISAAAAYHHHLSTNPMPTNTDVSTMIPYSQPYHQHHGVNLMY